MNENLNLIKILKDCPKGTKLYSTVLGEVELYYVENSGEYPIQVLLKDDIDSFTKDGRLFSDKEGECVLFPSKEQRDWSKFNVSMYKKEQKSVDKIEPRFKVGDWIITPKNQVLQITSIAGTSYRFNNVSHYWEICYCDEQCRLWTIQDAKDGDILVSTWKGHSYIYIFKEIENNIIVSHVFYYPELNTIGDGVINMANTPTIPATKEQRDTLMKAMNDAGYKWDSEKKELKKEKVKQK